MTGSVRLTFFFLAIAALPVFADDRLRTSLRHLEPATRMLQVCNIEAINRVGRDRNPYRPNRAVIDAVSQPKIAENKVQGSGGAFRSGGRWYQFSYTCEISPDHMQVLSFAYQVGAPIPEEKWNSYGLWR